ncbi:MAG: AAA family ATPase [Chitinophagaceae bacterium]|nr:MAG: AAA family ATPase [Chitinophagaceae bacterium]
MATTSAVGQRLKQLTVIIIIFGLPGCGKTYFAKALAHTLCASYINSDIIRESFAEPHRYSLPDKSIVYDMMLTQTLTAMHECKTVVVDATFYKENFRRRFRSYFRDQGMLHFIEVVADERLIKNRLARREDGHADFSVYKLIKKDWDPIQFSHLTVQSTDDNLGDMVSKVLEYIKPHIANQIESDIN